MFVILGLLSHWAACIWGWIGELDQPGSAAKFHELQNTTKKTHVNKYIMHILLTKAHRL